MNSLLPISAYYLFRHERLPGLGTGVRLRRSPHAGERTISWAAFLLSRHCLLPQAGKGSSRERVHRQETNTGNQPVLGKSLSGTTGRTTLPRNAGTWQPAVKTIHGSMPNKKALKEFAVACRPRKPWLPENRQKASHRSASWAEKEMKKPRRRPPGAGFASRSLFRQGKDLDSGGVQFFRVRVLQVSIPFSSGQGFGLLYDKAMVVLRIKKTESRSLFRQGKDLDSSRTAKEAASRLNCLDPFFVRARIWTAGLLSPYGART